MQATANVELLAGAIRQMSDALYERSYRSCGVACLLFKMLSRDEALGRDLCAACDEASCKLERLILQHEGFATNSRRGDPAEKWY